MSDWNFEGMTTKSCENDEDYYQHQIDYFIALEQKNQEEREKWEANGRKGKYSQYYLHHLSFMPEEGTPYSLNYSEKTLKEQLKTLETDLKASSLDPFDKMGVYNAIQRLLDAQPLEADDIERWDAPRLFQPNYFGFGTTRVADDGTPIYETVMAPQGVTLFASVEAARRTGMLAFTDTGNEKAFIIYSNGKGKYWLGPLKHGTRDHIEIGLGEQPGVIEEICHSHYGSDPSEKDIQTAILAAAYNQRTYGINRSAVSHYDMNSGKWGRVAGTSGSPNASAHSTLGASEASSKDTYPRLFNEDGTINQAVYDAINDHTIELEHYKEVLAEVAVIRKWVERTYNNEPEKKLEALKIVNSKLPYLYDIMEDDEPYRLKKEALQKNFEASMLNMTNPFGWILEGLHAIGLIENETRQALAPAGVGAWGAAGAVAGAGVAGRAGGVSRPPSPASQGQRPVATGNIQPPVPVAPSARIQNVGKIKEYNIPNTLSQHQAKHVGMVKDGRSVLKADPAELLKGLHNGEYRVLRKPKDGQIIVDFGKPIGDYCQPGKNYGPSQYGNVMYGKDGAHIYPASPNQW